MTLNFPPHKLKIIEENALIKVFDVVRKQYVVFTPEEEVRQLMLHTFHYQLNIPFALMAVEKAIKYGQLSKRPDAVIFDKKGKPLLIAECKAPDITITPETVFQIAAYHKVLMPPWLFITNGMSHYTLKINSEGKFEMQDGLPTYDEMCQFATK